MINMRFWAMVFVIIFVVFFATQLKFYPQLKFNSVTSRLLHPFDTRLRYKIGEIDPRFNLTHQQLLELTEQAADIWHLGTNKELFIYDPAAQLTINLVYDERQANSQARTKELDRIEGSKSVIDKERTKLRELEAQLHHYKRQIEILESNYQAKVEIYNQWVNSVNANRQANLPETIKQLEYQKEKLKSEHVLLRQQIDFFNAKVDEVNNLVNAINSMSDQINQSVDYFNTRFKPYQFDKGVFNGRTINIYEFHSINDLRLTLAHELGHGLGIVHTNDPESLMYPYMEKQNLDNFSLKAADVALLNSRN